MMPKKPKPNLGRSPLPKQKGGPHKTPFDYDRRKWKEIADEETEKGAPPPEAEEQAEG